MPDRITEYLQGAAPDFMVPASEGDVQNMAIIHALRATADSMKRLSEQQDRQSSKMDNIAEKIGETNTRLAVLEQSGIAAKVQEHDKRIGTLEEESQRRKGAIGLWDFVLKSWPALIGFVALLAVLAATGNLQ